MLFYFLLFRSKYFCGDLDLCLIMSDINYNIHYYNNILLNIMYMHFKQWRCSISPYLPQK